MEDVKGAWTFVSMPRKVWMPGRGLLSTWGWFVGMGTLYPRVCLTVGGLTTSKPPMDHWPKCMICNGWNFTFVLVPRLQSLLGRWHGKGETALLWASVLLSLSLTNFPSQHTVYPLEASVSSSVTEQATSFTRLRWGRNEMATRVMSPVQGLKHRAFTSA